MTTQPPIKAVIFDLDGTLLDTEGLSSLAIQEVLDPFGKTFTWEIKKKILGLRGEAWAEIVIDDLGLQGDLDPGFLVRQWETNLERRTGEVAKMEGADEITKEFARRGIPQAIATSSYKELVAHKRRTHEELFSRMALIVCGDDPEVKTGKPAPDIYLVAASRLGVDPSECLVFEDALTGVQAGKAAGMRVVAIPDARLDLEAFAIADHVITSLRDFDPSQWGLQ